MYVITQLGCDIRNNKNIYYNVNITNVQVADLIIVFIECCWTTYNYLYQVTDISVFK